MEKEFIERPSMEPCSLHIEVRGVARLFVESVE